MSPLKRSSSSSFGSDAASETSSPTKCRKPMRKRAKTQEEKEERAQERIMRNRAAAQVSRERKREHMVLLEQENQDLQQKLTSLTTDNTDLRSTVSSLTQRLEQMERMMAFFMAPGTIPITDQQEAPLVTNILDDDNDNGVPSTYESAGLTHPFYCPSPPGTVRPQDLQSNASFSSSSPLLEPLDSRNPAVIVNGPQRRLSMRFPWNLSSRSPIYRQMTLILSFWTTLLCATSLRVSTNLATIFPLMQRVHFPKQFSHRALDHWRFAATGPDARASDADVKMCPADLDLRRRRLD